MPEAIVVEVGATVERLHPVAGDIVVLSYADYLAERSVQPIRTVAEKLRQQYPAVVFLVLPDVVNLQHLPMGEEVGQQLRDMIDARIKEALKPKDHGTVTGIPPKGTPFQSVNLECKKLVSHVAPPLHVQAEQQEHILTRDDTGRCRVCGAGRDEIHQSNCLVGSQRNGNRRELL